jgi:hypothetical protein
VSGGEVRGPGYGSIGVFDDVLRPQYEFVESGVTRMAEDLAGERRGGRAIDGDGPET